ncbi:MAG: penicillin-binding protein 2 [Candidatus Liptonbacteria bacterium]|nr:penicillin-binding protein 2 [Candidatus Liptonbacteria bacterium]
MNWRYPFLIVATTGMYLFLFLHLYQIQLVDGGYYLERAETQYFASGILKAKRGTIYFLDKNDNRLAVAVNKNFPVIYAVPSDIEDVPGTVRRLAELFPQAMPALEKGLSREESSYYLLQRKADSDMAAKIANEKIKGVYVNSVPERFYQFGTLAAHLLGFVGADSAGAGESGRYGLEKFYDNTLSGVSGKTENGKIIQPRDGEDLVLTVDMNIQREAERILGALVKDYNAKGGTVIVEEPATGKILAMGGYPNFNPNNYSQGNIGDFLNPMIQKIYEPGSVFKVITMAAGIDLGKITPDTTYIDAGALTINGRKISNYDFQTRGAYGKATMTNVIEHSINTGAVFAEGKIGNEPFRDYLLKFGFRQKTGIDLPGEVSGDLKPLFSRGAPQVNFATASFGQGVAVTPIELISAIAAIANGGKMMRPYVNSASAPQEVAAVINPSTARLVIEMMVSAVDKANVAAIKGYSIAGKTGTAYVPNFKHGGYTDNVINTYVGFGPADNPRFIALIKLDEPENAPLAGVTVVPAFRDLAQFIFNYYNVPPDRL